MVRKVLPIELSKHKTLGDVDFLSEDSLVGRLFKYMFRSQGTNTDSIGAYVAHLLNCMIKEFPPVEK